MQKRKRQPPSYRQRKGYDQAIVTLTDSVTGFTAIKGERTSAAGAWTS